ncbi:MAG: ABC transporter permease [Candidatus Erginobacter occultus]|nr:ABC transporter permease [Candidatus Erginobacter occultus]
MNNTSRTVSGGGGPVTVSVREPLTDQRGRDLLRDIGEMVSRGNREIRIDLSGLEKLDSSGCAWLIRAVRAGKEFGGTVTLTGASGRPAELLKLMRPNFEPLPPPPPRPGFVERTGEKALAVREEIRQAVSLVVDALYWSFIAPVEGKGVRWKGLLDEIQQMGSSAIGIVCMINFLLGLVIAMLSAVQLRLFGMEILVASGVVIGFARELAAVMTGIVVSARTGAAVTAELATMKVSEEIDALKGMGLPVSRFLVAPKILAILISMPILTILGFLSGVAGGFVLGIFSLGFTFDRWWWQTAQAVNLGDLSQGLVKSVFFALIIVLVGCHNGLRVRGGASEVGKATTRAVVMDIFLIIVADMFFATIFYYTT